MGRAPCCDEKVALKKGPWTPDEDQKLVAYIQEHGHGSWRALPEKAGLARCGKSCRLRWTNYLRPDIKRGRFSHEEDEMIIQLHAILGNRWSAIASHLPRRTDNEIKNYWNTHLKKRLVQMGIDPVTHQTSSTTGLALSPAWKPLVSTQLTHTTQWHCALAEAEARLSRSAGSVLLRDHHLLVPPHPSSLFMRSWKTKVQDTIRPTYCAVKLEPAAEGRSLSRPQNLHRKDWNAALGISQTQSTITDASPSLEKLYSAPMAMKSIPLPSQSFQNSASGQLQANISEYSLPIMDMNTFTDSAIRPNGPDFFQFAAHMGLENHFSPTSILQGPDSDSCSGSGDSDHCKFEFLHQSGSYHRFPLIDGEYGEHAESASNMSCDIPESFWPAPGQPADLGQAGALLEDLKSCIEGPVIHQAGEADDQLQLIVSNLPCFGAY